MVCIKIDIVGGSLGGLSTAISLKERDPSINVVVHEKYKQIGYNHEGRRCGEAYSLESDWARWKPEPASVFGDILHATVHIGATEYKAERAPGTAFMLNRQEFICQLARQAQRLGAVIQTGDLVKSPDDLDGDYIVDASGCPSTIRRELGLRMGFFGTTYQHTLQNANCFIPNTIDVTFTQFMGYFWVFPRNPATHEVNVGVGLLGNYGYDLKRLLEEFKIERGISGTINYTLGGLVPLGLQRPLRHHHILFVGDAGVGAFPMSGQGIYRALMSGEAAGACLANHEANKYPVCMQREFLKWELFCRNYMRLNLICRKIRPNFYIESMNFISRHVYDLSILTHG